MASHLLFKLIEAGAELMAGEQHAKDSKHPDVTRAMSWAHVAAIFLRK